MKRRVNIISENMIFKYIKGAIMPPIKSRRIKMESNLYRMIQLLELQLVKTDLADAWLRRIWQDKINELMLKVTRLTN